MIRFGSEADILEHTRFVLPESLDPPYDQRSTPWVDRNTPHGPLWFNVRLDHFAARIISPDGSWGEVGVFTSIEREQVRTIRSMETAWSYVIDLQSVAPGDVVEVRWKYMVPYDNNWEATQGWRAFQWLDNWSRLTSWRVFFHGDLPIRKQVVSLSYNLKHGVMLGGEAPTSKEENGNNVIAIWEHADLPGCMNEPNSRPGTDLQFFTVRLSLEDLRYWRRDRLSGLPLQQPYWMQVLRAREEKAFFWLRVAKKLVPDRQNTLLKAYVDRMSGGVPDQLTARRMELMHEDIADNFIYEDDHLWYMDVDRGLARIGDQLDQERLRDISRYDLYAKLCNSVQAPYSTAYLLDSRVGAMDDRWMTPLWDNEFLFGVRDGDQVQWMHPKRSRSGLFANELPFYWQGTPALLMDLEHLQLDFPDPPLFIDLPVDDPTSNVRGTEFTLDVDLEESGMSGKVRVFLSGQFSTIGRAAYQGLPIDGTVDPLYGRKPFVGNGISMVAQEPLSFERDPPFRARVAADIHVDDLLVMQEEGRFTIDLSNLVSHVVPGSFDAVGRVLPFYWDFPQDDRVIIELHFERDVELLNAEEFQQTIATPISRIERIVERPSPRTVRVESRFRVAGEKEDMHHVKELAEVIRVAQATDLQLRITASPRPHRP